MMLYYTVIDRRLRTYLGQVEGITHDQCLRNAKTKFETPLVKIDCYPSPPEYKGPPNSGTESARVEEVPRNDSDNPIFDILVDPGYASLLDHRYTGESFGFEKDTAVVVSQGAAEAALSSWAQRKFNLDPSYAARVFLVAGELVVVVHKVE